MKRQDWIDYFEAVNGRPPTAQEYAQALAAGDFVEESVDQQIPQQQVPPQQAPFSHQVQANFEQFQNTQQVQDFKSKGKNFLDWFIGALKNPIPTAEVGQFNYGLITLGLSAIFMGGGLVNYLRRIFNSLANASISGESLKVAEPEIYDRVMVAISSNFGWGKVVQVSLIYFALYALIAFLPALINRWFSKSTTDWKEDFGRSSQFLPLLTVISLVAFLSSFLVKNELIISENYFYSISNIGYYFEDNPLTAINTIISLTKEVPAIKSIVSVSTYISLASVVAFLVLLVAFIKNIKSSYKQFNEFYVSLIALVVVLGAVYFADKMVLDSIVTSLVGVFERIKDLI